MHGIIQLVYYCPNSEATGQVCTYIYFTQPPSNITCNVYNSETIILECSVRSLDAANYTVNWYYEGELITNVSTGHLEFITSQPGLPTMYFHVSRIGLERSDILPGHYYCQIQLIDNSTDIEFRPSNMLYLREEEFFQNTSSCDGNFFSTNDDKCACTCTNVIGTTDTTDVSNSTTPIDTTKIPIWGYVLVALASVIILVIMILVVNLFAYLKYRQGTKQKLLHISIHDYEVRSEQDTLSTDHTYEDLDACVLKMELREQHFPVSESQPHPPSQDTTQSQIKSSSDASEGYDKLQPISLPSVEGAIAMENVHVAHNDQLDPRVDANMTYRLRDTHDPHTASNKSYNQLEPITVTNKAYNIRDELDPHTNASQAYNAMSPQ